LKGSKIPNCAPANHDRNYHAISITDNGIGFEEQYNDLIFVIFKRLHSSSNFEGTGIGLAICKKIADKHEGYIYAKSKLNEGSTFTLALPETSIHEKQD
jgi:light-regulated signal transduction histidine kinase (bacteriophytochrome)